MLARFCTTLAVATTICLAASPAMAQQTWRVSLSSGGTQANGNNRAPNTSALGRYTAFKSDANNLVPGDTNGWGDIFLHDRYLGTTTLISRTPAALANGESFNPSISNDGRFTVFFSEASNLVPADTNNRIDVFVYDHQTGAIERASKSSAGGQGNNDSDFAEISGNGRYVVYRSLATNLVPNDLNGMRDSFLYDRNTGQTTRVTVNSAGAEANGHSDWADVSDDGQIVSFESEATNLVPSDTNGVTDVFYRNLTTNTTHRVSVSTGGVQGNLGSHVPTLSANGHVIAFSSDANTLVAGIPGGNIFAHDRFAGTTVAVSTDLGGAPGNGTSSSPSIDHLGRYVAFESHATNLVAGDTNATIDIFLRDLQSTITIIASVDSAGAIGNAASHKASISPEGRYVAFRSLSTNLVPGDTNFQEDIFLREISGCAASVIYCTAKVNSLGCLPSIGSLGSPSAIAGSGFVLTCANVRNGKPGLILYGVNGSHSAPFQGGTLCVMPPLRRTIVVVASGNPPPVNDCSGKFSIDMNAFALGHLGGSPALELQVVGQTVHLQWWGRDNGFPAPFNTMLSNGLSYTICP